MNEFVVLDSGFITPKVEGVTLTKKEDATITMMITKPYRIQADSFYIATTLNQYYEEYMFDSRIIKSFEFRDRFMKEAIRLFNSPSMYQWMVAQGSSPYLSPIAFSFLKDTLNFIGGDNRQVELMSWLNMIEPQKDATDKFKVDRAIKAYFLKEYRNTPEAIKLPFLPSGLTDFIQMWVSRQDGFKDFIMTLGLIFGNHKRNMMITKSPLYLNNKELELTPVEEQQEE